MPRLNDSDPVLIFAEVLPFSIAMIIQFRRGDSLRTSLFHLLAMHSHAVRLTSSNSANPPPVLNFIKHSGLPIQEWLIKDGSRKIHNKNSLGHTNLIGGGAPPFGVGGLRLSSALLPTALAWALIARQGCGRSGQGNFLWQSTGIGCTRSGQPLTDTVEQCP